MSSTRSLPLTAGWQLARTAPGAFASPAQLPSAALEWREARVPGTVASSLGKDVAEAGRHDADDYWYRVTFAAPRDGAGARFRLRFEGLATLADAWLNGEPILSSRNMFIGHRVDVTDRMRDVNHLVIRFSSLAAALAEKRRRPRWKTALVEEQNLRWFRTTLLGRMPGWSPLIEPVGPWGPVALDFIEGHEVTSLNLQARAENGRGIVQVRGAAQRVDGGAIDGARLCIGETVHDLTVLQGDDARFHGDAVVDAVPLWWPHTHGTPARMPWQLELCIDNEWVVAERGLLGFKEIALDTREGRMQLLLNGVPVFCRGAVWTTMDMLALRGSGSELRRVLTLARDAGINMLRVGGTMTYESDEFYALCDELGILVWQDFMFANMDYPFADPAFRGEAEAEIRYQLARLHRHPSIAVYCGGSEVAQQAAMMGLAAEHWTSEFFTATLPGLCASEHAAIPYFPSSPWGGALPFHVASGIAHYYGVGAYRRPIAEVKSARVKFASECLGFSNMPEDANIARLGSAAIAPHHPGWKAGVPRDNGAGYDFEDVRDHYLEDLFGCSAVALRAQDPARYRAVSRVVSGEVMKRVIAEWRSPYNPCSGALVWFMRDLRPGAGWGVLDSDGQPKPVYWALKRAFAPQSLHLTDEGLDGLAIRAANDGAQLLDATVEVEMYKDGRLLGRAQSPLLVPPRTVVTRMADALLGLFTDHTNAYRFGPAKYDVIAVRLRRNDNGAVVSEDFHFPVGMGFALQCGVELRQDITAREDGAVVLTLQAKGFLQSVRIAGEGFSIDDNYFHLAPGQEKRVVLRRLDPHVPFHAWIEALNLAEPVPLQLAPALPAANDGPALRPGTRPDFR
jgi:beta-mannosidase